MVVSLVLRWIERGRYPNYPVTIDAAAPRSCLPTQGNVK